MDQPSALNVINAASAAHLQSVRQLGRGMLFDLAISPDGSSLALTGSH